MHKLASWRTQSGVLGSDGSLGVRGGASALLGVRGASGASLPTQDRLGKQDYDALLSLFLCQVAAHGAMLSNELHTQSLGSLSARPIVAFPSWKHRIHITKLLIKVF